MNSLKRYKSMSTDNIYKEYLKREQTKKVVEIGNAVHEEYERSVFEAVKNDIVAQLMAVVFTVLNKDFGFGKDRLMKVKKGTEELFKIMLNGGICGQEFNTQNCLDYMKDKFDIDLDKKE